ncbi:hypothetical protein Q0Z83_034270 [Actinoplanes sichuanensis]|uniref:GNAT family N-acetyltransferase n=1 Tax=Actinoplanes sichuanensis TaxID=512349 RepID=A0ABW4AUT2_9ACTN|nr:GNAT family N-acetyltransferase [Actinoplanes sichuanensis]BEL05236.1 hypothetical protein Q0Z83_034270 [Actinoplanes sichuanensis]
MTPTPPVTLRALVAADAAVITGWASDPEFARAAGWTRQDHEQHHRRLIQTPPPDLIRLGAVVGGELVGYVDLHGVEVDHRELGFVIGGRDRWGRGLGLGAAAAGLDYGFTVLRLREIRAAAAATNQRSVRILTRLGFQARERSGAYLSFAIEAHAVVDRPA